MTNRALLCATMDGGAARRLLVRCGVAVVSSYSLTGRHSPTGATADAGSAVTGAPSPDMEVPRRRFLDRPAPRTEGEIVSRSPRIPTAFARYLKTIRRRCEHYALLDHMATAADRRSGELHVLAAWATL